MKFSNDGLTVRSYWLSTWRRGRRGGGRGGRGGGGAQPPVACEAPPRRPWQPWAPAGEGAALCGGGSCSWRRRLAACRVCRAGAPAARRARAPLCRAGSCARGAAAGVSQRLPVPCLALALALVQAAAGTPRHAPWRRTRHRHAATCRPHSRPACTPRPPPAPACTPPQPPTCAPAACPRPCPQRCAGRTAAAAPRCGTQGCRRRG
jgi:hypothetical protein